MWSYFWLMEEQFNKISPLLPNKPRGVPCVGDRRVLSGIIFCIRRGSHWFDVPAEYGPSKTLYNRWKRWCEVGIFERIFETLACETDDLSSPMIDASRVKTHRIAANGNKRHAAQTGHRHRRLRSRRQSPARLAERNRGNHLHSTPKNRKVPFEYDVDL